MERHGFQEDEPTSEAAAEPVANQDISLWGKIVRAARPHLLRSKWADTSAQAGFGEKIVLHLRRPRSLDFLRVFWSAASTRSDNLIQRLNISSSAVGASQKLGARQKAMMLATVGVKKKARFVCSALQCPSVINISWILRHPKFRTPVNKGYAIGSTRLCTIQDIVYNRVTEGHGLALSWI
jgi:hypothetical protein